MTSWLWKKSVSPSPDARDLRNRALGMAALAFLSLAASCSKAPPSKADGEDWPAWGRTAEETHDSPLTQINKDNIGRLGLVASMDLPNIHNAGTVPLEVDGVIYFGIDQSIVYAYDVRTQKQLWRYDPKVAATAGVHLRPGWGQRGIAYSHGRVYVGTIDGRLIAIDAKSGQKIWDVQTFEADVEGSRFVSGPPRAFGDLVVIGNGGADFQPMRGYVTAYDSATGKKAWRFYTVPGDPAKGFESPAMEMAAKTWTGTQWHKGGGGTVWNAMTYDPELGLLYLGTGNGAPWNPKIRSPEGGDNLFLSSIVALDAKTGEYRWHYQVNPAEAWDYTATMDMIAATLTIDGQPRKVLMQAPKNGFFYVIDRTNGKIISAEKIAKATWASGIDLTTGRPIEEPGIRYANKPILLWPGQNGAHSWAPMALSSATGFVYIPVNNVAAIYDDSGIDTKHWKPAPLLPNMGVGYKPGDWPTNAGDSFLLAWDPVAQKKVWSVPTPGILNGGVMTTASGLVFQGRNDGHLNAYDAADGKLLWSFNAKMGISGAPITFLVDGKQYIAMLAGWGGAPAALGGSMNAQHGWQFRHAMNRLQIFALDGTAQLPAGDPRYYPKPLINANFKVDRGRADRGADTFSMRCGICHGAGVKASGHAPDLRESPIADDLEAFTDVVKNGGLEPNGMPKFGELTKDDLLDIQHYIRQRANETAKENPKPPEEPSDAPVR